MPSTLVSEHPLDKSKPVCVTGADGYVAGVLCRALLSQGVTVHATVLPTSKTDHLEALAKELPGSIKFFEANLLDADAFDAPMKGCSTLFHTASPFLLGSHVDPYRDLIQPAVQGVTHVLQAATASGTVKRVVMTSSCGSLFTDNADAFDHPDKVLDETCWNRTATVRHQPYFLSKTMAEQRAWVMAGCQTQWTLATIHPSMIWGKGIKYHANSESFKLLGRLAAGHYSMVAGAPGFAIGVVDVQDVAAAHVAAVHAPAGRYLVSGHTTSFPDLARLLRTAYPTYPIPAFTAPVPKFVAWLLIPIAVDLGFTRTFISRNLYVPLHLDTKKSVSDLGMQYRPLSDTVLEMYQQMIQNGGAKPGWILVIVLTTFWNYAVAWVQRVLLGKDPKKQD